MCKYKTLAVVFQTINADECAAAVAALERAKVPFEECFEGRRSAKYPNRKFRIMVAIVHLQQAYDALANVPGEMVSDELVEINDVRNESVAQLFKRLLLAVLFIIAILTLVFALA